MKTIQNITSLFLLIILATAAGCKKDPVMYSKGIESFKLVAKNVQGVETEYLGTISNEEIIVELPIEVDVTSLTSTYTVDNPRTIVQIGSEVVEPGVTELDLSTPVDFTVKAEDKSKRSYRIRVEKKTSLKSFGFYKEDNAGLTEDYRAVIRGLKIDVAVPETIDLTKLVGRFETTDGAVVKVGDVTQQSRTTANDFSNTIIYTFNAPGLTAPLNFTTALSFIGPKWWMIGDETIIGTGAGDLKMAINPITKYPYLVYFRTGKDESGTAIATENRKAVVIAYTGNDWQFIGSSNGISDTQAADTHIAFDEEGTPYVAYKDYFEAGQKATVLKYVNNVWTAQGAKNFSPMRTDKFSFAIGENDQPFLGVSTGTAVTGYARRAIYVTNYTNGIWNDITPAIVNPLIAAVKMIKGQDGKTYMAVLDRNTNFSMYKYQNNTWIPVGPVGFRTSDGLPGYTSVTGAVDAQGTAYIAFHTVSASQRLNRVMKFNGTAWVELGSAGNSQGKDELYALAIDPNGKLYFAFVNNSGLYFRTFNENTNNWNTARQVIAGNIGYFDMQISQDGIPYIAVATPGLSDNKVTVYKYTTTK
jgi:hypothetical protein